MAVLKHNKQADGVANLYRSALYLAKGDEQTGLLFLKKATDRIHDQRLAGLEQLLKTPDQLLIGEKEKRLWAERVLDAYHIFSYLLRVSE